MKMTSTNRKKIQSALADLGFYKSSIDGLYGKGTAAALKDYNKEYLGNYDLTITSNANALLRAVLKSTLDIDDKSNPPHSACFTDPTACNDVRLCSLATVGLTKSISKEFWRGFIDEAERRGLSCIQQADNTSTIAEKKVDMSKSESEKTVKPEPTPKLELDQVKASYDEKDYKKAFADAQVLAIEGNPEAQLLLGKMFADGLGTVQVRKSHICGSI